MPSENFDPLDVWETIQHLYGLCKEHFGLVIEAESNLPQLNGAVAITYLATLGCQNQKPNPVVAFTPAYDDKEMDVVGSSSWLTILPYLDRQNKDERGHLFLGSLGTSHLPYFRLKGGNMNTGSRRLDYIDMISSGTRIVSNSSVQTIMPVYLYILGELTNLMSSDRIIFAYYD